MVKRRLSKKKKGGALANAWTRQQVKKYLRDQNNGNRTWLSRNDSQDSFFVNDFETIDPLEDEYSHTIVNGKKGWTIMTEWLLEHPDGIPMIREDVENELLKHGWEVEPDGLFGSLDVGFQITKFDMSNNNSSNVSLENVPLRTRSRSRSRSMSSSNSNSNGNAYKGRKKKYSKKKSNKKTPMVIRNGNVVMCKSNSN